VLPCFDEAPNVEVTVGSALAVGRSLSPAFLEVIVVDDGSRDGTAARVERIAESACEVRLVQHGVNRGYGAALRSGLRAARADWVFYTDGDGQFDLRELPELLSRLERYDVVSGYRMGRRDGAWRNVSGVAWTRLVNWLFDLDVRDVNCAFKVYPAWLFRRIEMTSDGALVDAEVLSQARALGLRIGEMGVRHLPRRAGAQSGGDPRVVAKAFAELHGMMRRRARGIPAGGRAAHAPAVTTR
jgi:glycosyltransferase involved in cell wall biosynthesis